MFADDRQEQAFSVKGGLLWFHHVLIAAVELSKSYQIRLYSRDLELSNQNVLHREVVSSPVVVLSLVDNSLLVYTADNTLYHYLIIPTSDTIKLHLCGSINFNGVIAVPSAVRVLSWMVPSAQKRLYFLLMSRQRHLLTLTVSEQNSETLWKISLLRPS